MKIGMRKPSLKKSFKARTTGRAKRAVKKAVIPGYGRKGMGWVTNPKKAAYNKVYHKTTFGVNDIMRAASSSTASHKTAKKQQSYRSSSSYKEGTAKDSNVITQANVKYFETVLDIDTSARLTPLIFLVAAIICIFSTVMILVIIGIILDLIALGCLCRKSYWTAHRYRQASLAYLQEDYDKCRKYLDKICDKEKQSDSYKEFMDKLNQQTSPYSSESAADENGSDDVQPDDAQGSTSSEEERNSDEINSAEELEIYNEVKDILSQNQRDLTMFYMKHTGVYCDFCVLSSVFLRVKLGGRKHYVLTNLSDEEIMNLHLSSENPSKSEKYRQRINLDNKDVVRKLTTYIIQEFDNCCIRN